MQNLYKVANNLNKTIGTSHCAMVLTSNGTEYYYADKYNCYDWLDNMRRVHGERS